jgi:uncharacterized protein (TIGR02246 family)
MRTRPVLATVVATLLSAAVLVPAPAGAGGPTSALLSIPGSGQTASLYYTDPEYDELSGLVGVAEPSGTFDGEESGSGHESGPGVTVTWLVHDVEPWRVDRIYLGDKGEVWISTQMGFGASLWDNPPVWHQPANGKRLAALLGELGLADKAATDESFDGVAGASTPDETPPASEPATLDPEPAAADRSWTTSVGLALGGLAAGVLLTLGPDSGVVALAAPHRCGEDRVRPGIVWAMDDPGRPRRAPDVALTEQVAAQVAEQVAAQVAARSEALVAGDAARMREVLADDFTYTNASGASCGREEYIASYVDSPAVTWQSQEASNQEIRVYGDAAVVTLDVHDRATWQGEPFEGRFRSLFVYLRRDGRWLCVAGQTTSLPVEPAD